MAKIFTPTNQKRLTNVSIVKLKKFGIQFEIACYPNKVQPWRNKVEQDISEVLQTPTVFTNVSKGQLAKAADLQKAFGTEDHAKVCLIILADGSLKPSEQERQAQQKSLFRDIATVVADKCVNPETKRPYTVTIIEKLMKDVHFSVNPSRGAKQQALEVIQMLRDKDTTPIARAEMRLRVCVPAKKASRIKDKVRELASKVESENFDDELVVIILADPGCYRQLDELIQKETQGTGSLQVLSLKEVEDGDEL